MGLLVTPCTAARFMISPGGTGPVSHIDCSLLTRYKNQIPDHQDLSKIFLKTLDIRLGSTRKIGSKCKRSSFPYTDARVGIFVRQTIGFSNGTSDHHARFDGDRTRHSNCDVASIRSADQSAVGPAVTGGGSFPIKQEFQLAMSLAIESRRVIKIGHIKKLHPFRATRSKAR